MPRFQGEALDHNQKLVQQLQGVAEKYKATSAQIALAWLFAKDSCIVPIPGTRRKRYLKDNCDAVEIVLNTHDISLLNTIFKIENIQGARYSEKLMKAYNMQDNVE